MTRAQEIENAISELWKKFDANPFALVAIVLLQERRERHKGWLYEDYQKITTMTRISTDRKYATAFECFHRIRHRYQIANFN